MFIMKKKRPSKSSKNLRKLPKISNAGIRNNVKKNSVGNVGSSVKKSSINSTDNLMN